MQKWVRPAPSAPHPQGRDAANSPELVKTAFKLASISQYGRGCVNILPSSEGLAVVLLSAIERPASRAGADSLAGATPAGVIKAIGAPLGGQLLVAGVLGQSPGRCAVCPVLPQGPGLGRRARLVRPGLGHALVFPGQDGAGGIEQLAVWSEQRPQRLQQGQLALGHGVDVAGLAQQLDVGVARS